MVAGRLKMLLFNYLIAQHSGVRLKRHPARQSGRCVRRKGLITTNQLSEMTRNLSQWQQVALLACSSCPCAYPEVIPHGVYRSLVIRGLLMRHRDGFEVTAQGRDYLNGRFGTTRAQHPALAD